ncbi:hypothetical protein [Polaribacter sp. Hel_I_88]|uniref:hypothetical protein n=1 Tax=Polaribacter sp. Hel_I_88 TaxID=1250006 RepID=UPI00047DD7FF|nr:hypothetical protein [Polaribacter sp. Hel_I_88]
MFYYILIAFQAFCIFHVYKSRNENYWYFVIFLVPLIGSLIYLFSQIINKNNIKKTKNKLTEVVNPTKKIKDLEQKLAISDTFQNKIYLADEYKNQKDYNNAILYYEKALEGKFKNNSHTINKVLKCYFEIKNYSKVVEYAKKIPLDTSFKGSICIHALALEKCNFFEEAELQFRKTNIRYSNYGERLQLSEFLVRIGKQQEAKVVLEEIIGEIDNMTEINQKKYRVIYLESRKLLKSI